MNSLRESQHLYDGRLPELYFAAELEDDDLPVEVSDADVERFIAALAVHPDPARLLKDAANQHFAEDGDFDLHLSVARQWIVDKEKVGCIIGPVFWTWMKRCAYEVAV